jgi:hypothetical protein
MKFPQRNVTDAHVQRRAEGGDLPIADGMCALLVGRNVSYRCCVLVRQGECIVCNVENSLMGVFGPFLDPLANALFCPTTCAELCLLRHQTVAHPPSLSITGILELEDSPMPLLLM